MMTTTEEELRPGDPKYDNEGNPIAKVLKRDKRTGQAKRIVVKVLVKRGTEIEVIKDKLKGGKWRVYTEKNTVDAKQVILAIKEEYANFRKEGVYEIQLRNMQYKLMERPELKLGYLQNPYSRLSDILTDARN